MVVFASTKCSRTFSRRFNLERHAEEAHGNRKIDEEESDEEMHDGEEVESEEREQRKAVKSRRARMGKRMNRKMVKVSWTVSKWLHGQTICKLNLKYLPRVRKIGHG